MTAVDDDRQHWSDSANDPMDPQLMAERQARLRAARAEPVADRVDYLRRLARGRKVLDLGVVDHNSDSDRREHWLHGQLAEVSSEILGLDVVADEVELLASRGFTVASMDVTRGEMPPGEWELIVAGELVEHLGNPGGLFEAADRMLSAHGTFVLTTPNPYALWRVFQNINDRTHENLDHALLLSPWGIIELAERNGLVLSRYRGIGPHPVGWKARVADLAVRSRVLGLTPESTCESVMYEIRRPRSTV
jgi:2-polyprenyl-3-methyl-5-hydroxy-6-metoxy-1,4-benzoquinol methylase